MRDEFMKRALEKFGSKTLERLNYTLTSDPYYQGGLRASGNLASSMYYKIVNDTIEIYMAEYGKTVDEGRRKGAGLPKGFENDILTWMSFRGINARAGKTKLESAKAIANSIYREGTIKRFGYSGSNFIDRAVNDSMNVFGNDLLTAFMKDLEAELDKILK